jgi:hypothetical protein
LKRKDYIALVIVILAITGIVFYTIYSSGKRKEAFYWEKTYQDRKVQPYDFGVFKGMLEHKSGKDFEMVYDGLQEKIRLKQDNDSSTYLFIGRYCYLNRGEIDALLAFAHAGHEVVFIAEGLPDTLLQTLSYFSKPVNINRFDEAGVQVETFREQSKTKERRFYFRGIDQDTSKEVIDWYYLDEGGQLSYYFEGTGNRYIKLGRINGKLNAAKFKVGNGYVYIHTSPILFTNYALRNDSGFYYADEILSGINMNNLIYDVYSRDYKPDSEHIQRKSDSPLSYILKQPALKMAWYLFLAAVVLFFLFKAKRKQRIIPVLEQKRNTSVKFIETLSGLFYSDANHQKMAETRMNLFLFFLRSKLNISTHDISPEVIKLMAIKSKVPEKEIQLIFDYYYQVIRGDRNEVHAENLMEFYNRINNFYRIYNNKK